MRNLMRFRLEESLWTRGWNHSSRRRSGMLEPGVGHLLGGWSTYVSTALSSHKDDNLMPLQFKKKQTWKVMQGWKNKTTTYSVLMLRCLAFGGVGGAAARRSRRRFGSSFEVCISNRLSIRSLQLVWVQIHSSSCVQITRLIQTCSCVSASTDSKQSKMF